ncbi:hypothetical protein BVI2075_1400014 [Burkholderia vietnamiensis]|nr:hypothetical protein BVI2075_1400014 [Burkholderia vietnamiensis]CAG9199573.1 hypothetical protein BVI1335_1430014 [Burkholderia vietnamiensis]
MSRSVPKPYPIPTKFHPPSRFPTDNQEIRMK